MSCWPPSCTCPTHSRASFPAPAGGGAGGGADPAARPGVRPGRVRKDGLLAHWARVGSLPVAWLSVDAADNDPARFWRHVVAALERVRPEIGERAGPLLVRRRRLIRGAGHGADQQTGRRARGGPGAAGPRRLPAHRGRAGARDACVPAGAPAGRACPALASGSDPPGWLGSASTRTAVAGTPKRTWSRVSVILEDSSGYSMELAGHLAAQVRAQKF